MRSGLQWSVVATCASFLLLAPVFAQLGPVDRASRVPPAIHCVADPASLPAQDGPWPDRMRGFLMWEYLGNEYVEPGAVVITASQNYTMGDIPVQRVEAIVAADCAGVVAYFRGRDGSFIATWFPDYRAVSNQKLDWEVVRQMRNDTTQDILIYLKPTDDRLSQLERFHATVANIDGVWDLDGDVSIWTATATAAGVAVVAALPEVESIGSNEPNPAVLSQSARQNLDGEGAVPATVGPN